MEIDWIKLGSLLLGAVGSALGVYNFLVARRDRIQKEKHGYALMLLALEPIVDKLIEVPLTEPESLKAGFPQTLLSRLDELTDLVEKNKKDMVVLVPETASWLLNLAAAITALRKRVLDPNSSADQSLSEARDFLEVAWSLAQFRSHASGFSMPLNGQVKPSALNWTGDPKVKLLNDRWNLFFKATPLDA